MNLSEELCRRPRNIKTMFLFLTAFFLAPGSASAQSIEFTSIPPVGSNAYLYGQVHDVDPSKYGIAVIIDVFGSWWTKPKFDAPLTQIAAGLTFFVNITTGGQDVCAQRVAAFVVPRDYPLPLAAGAGSIPQDIIDHSITQLIVDRSGGSKELLFARRIWTKKDTGPCIWGPGSNFFAAGNSFVDTEGKLHLKITNTGGLWRCAEVILKESLGYGTYVFNVEGDFEHFPDPIVAGWFTYSDDAEFAHREIDVEHSNGDLVGRPNNWQYVVQPYNAPGQRLRFSVSPNTSQMVHSFTWIPGSVAFASFATNQVKPGLVMDYSIESADTVDFKVGLQVVRSLTISSATNIVVSSDVTTSSAKFYRARLAGIRATGDPLPFQSGNIESGVPPAANEKVHINFWLFEAMSPGATNQAYEMIVTNFEFESLKRIRLGVASVGNNELVLSFEYPGQ